MTYAPGREAARSPADRGQRVRVSAEPCTRAWSSGPLACPQAVLTCPPPRPPEYIIEFEGNKEDPGRWEELARVRGEETTALLALAPYVAYQFRVSAVNEVGRSPPSRPSERHETPPAGRCLPRRRPRVALLRRSKVLRWPECAGARLPPGAAWWPQGRPQPQEQRGPRAPCSSRWPVSCRNQTRQVPS